jgi:hypothetical protein
MTTPSITWNAKQQRWFAKYHHKQYTVSPKILGTAPTKEASVRAANDWWRDKRKELGALATETGKPTPDPGFCARPHNRGRAASDPNVVRLTAAMALLRM